LLHHFGNFPGRGSGGSSQTTYFSGNHAEAAACVTGTRRLNGGVQRQNICL